MTKVRKAVIAAAGFGTRFLPQTKAMPKEMLPLVDKPIIQYIVEELVDAGIEEIIIVSNSSKRAIEDHFDYPNRDLVANLQAGGPSKQHFLDEVESIAELANFAYIRQKGPYGTATPVLNAKHLIGDEPFIYTWGDDFIKATPSRFCQMIEQHEKTGGSIVPCIRVMNDEGYRRYGIVSGNEQTDGLIKMNGIIEKPGKDNAPSDLASVSGYLFTPEIFDYLDESSLMSERGELEIQPAMQKMIESGKDFYALEITNSKYYDAGNKLEYVKTIIDLALEHEDISEDFRSYLKELVKSGL